jgi:hypothetical protein
MPVPQRSTSTVVFGFAGCVDRLVGGFQDGSPALCATQRRSINGRRLLMAVTMIEAGKLPQSTGPRGQPKAPRAGISIGRQARLSLAKENLPKVSLATEILASANRAKANLDFFVNVQPQKTHEYVATTNELAAVLSSSGSTALLMKQPKEYRVMGQKGTAARTFSVIDLEDEIATALNDSPPVRAPRHIDFAPPSVRAPTLPLPEYLEHREGADEIGRLSAEAVAASYESAAQEIEKMGTELRERAQLCERMVAESNQALALIRETAAQFRDAGKVIFLRIEDCSLMTKEVRETCDNLRAKLAGPET